MTVDLIVTKFITVAIYPFTVKFIIIFHGTVYWHIRTRKLFNVNLQIILVIA